MRAQKRTPPILTEDVRVFPARHYVLDCGRIKRDTATRSGAPRPAGGMGRGCKEKGFSNFRPCGTLTSLSSYKTEAGRCVPGTVQGTENCRWHQSQSKGRGQRVNSLWSASLSHPRREPKPGERLCFPETFL